MRILGIGNALLDIVSFVEDDFPASIGIHSSSVSHYSRQDLQPILSRLPDPIFVSGGGAANTMKIASLLGLTTAFAGSIGTDRFGELFKGELEESGVRTLLSLDSKLDTGISLILKSRSGLSSILVAAGAALSLEGRNIPDSEIEAADWVYAEGYLLSREELLLSFLNRALMADKKIAFDLGSWRNVMANRPLAAEIVGRYADLVFCNSSELEALSGMSSLEAIDLFRPNETIMVCKLGAEGAVFMDGDMTLKRHAGSVEVVEETGAGDAFAAGYLFGLSKGYHPEHCLKMGNSIAALVLKVPGTRISPDSVEGLRV